MKNKIITYLQLHLFELKYNLILSFFLFIYLFLVCFFFSDQLIYIFVKNLIKYKMLKYFIFTNITEMFTTNLSISFLISSWISSPFIFLQYWFIFSKGLLKYENFKIIKFYLIFLLFNILITFIILIKIIPNIWFFFYKNSFSNQYLFNIYFEPKINNYFIFIFSSFIYIYMLLLYFNFLIFLILKNIFQISFIINLRKLFYFKFIIMATIIAPPDVFSQLIITFIFISIFEIYIYFYLFINKYIN